MRVKSTRVIRLLCLALWAACLVGAAVAQEPPVRDQPEKEQNPEAPAKPEEPAKPEMITPTRKRNARPGEGDAAAAKPEPFDKSTPEQMSKQCVTLATEEGPIEIEMLAEAAPESARNFLNLAATGAYDTTLFSRVVKGFVIQGGDLFTREKRTPELTRRATRRVPDEPSAVKHVRGIVSMARPNEPDSATTNFFILVGDAPHLDGTFSAFGRVRSGMEAVDKINGAELDGEKPKKPVHVTRATVAACSPPLS